MRTIPAALLAHTQLPLTTLAKGWKTTYQDPVLGPQTIGFTTASEDALISGVTYRSTASVNPVAVESQIGMNAGSSEFQGFFAIGNVLEAAIFSGKFDFADIQFFFYNWANLSNGIGILLDGKVSEIRIEGRSYIFSVVETIDQLSLNIGEVLSVDCTADLGDAKCKVRLDPPVWQASTPYTLTNTNDAAIGSVVKPVTQNRRHFRCTTPGTSSGTEPIWNLSIGNGTNDGGVIWLTLQARRVTGAVTAVSDRRIFADTSITEANNTWTFGKLTWLTGLNQGISMEIKSQLATQIELYLPMQRAIAVTDTYVMTMGCDKFKATCKNNFGNLYNFRGMPDKPASSKLLQYGTR